METIYIQEDGKRRKATVDELAQMDKDRAEQLERDLLLEAELTKKQADKDSAISKLKKLGLTDDEVSSLIP